MGLMSKINKMKNFLFDEEDEEKEVSKNKKKEIKNTEQYSKKIEEELVKQSDLISDNDMFFEDVSEEKQEEMVSRFEKKEQEHSYNLDDDYEYTPISKKKEVFIEESKKEEIRPLYQGSKRKDEFKKFKPSPIISPIYGLLDDEGNSIKEEQVEAKVSYNEEKSFDAVRKKAYGSLDEEMENTLKNLKHKTIEELESEMQEKETLSRENKKKKKEADKVKETKKDEYQEDDDDDDMILPNVAFKEIDIDKELKKEEPDEKKKSIEDDDDDDTKEQDLFNLIDTMYQKEGDEE